MLFSSSFVPMQIFLGFGLRVSWTSPVLFARGEMHLHAVPDESM